MAAYCAQLKYLHVAVLSASSVSSWFHLLFSRCDCLEDLSIAASMTVDRFSCPLELRLEPAAAGKALTLPKLRMLALARLPLTDDGWLSVLSRCPELENCTLQDMRYVTTTAEEAAWVYCPKLIQLSHLESTVSKLLRLIHRDSCSACRQLHLQSEEARE